MSPQHASHWYCLYTKPKKEPYVAETLATQFGLETYLPQLQRQRVIRRVRRLVTEPVFPRYLFCRFSLEERLRAVRYAPEVLSIVSRSGVPTPVPDATIQQLATWTREASAELQQPPRFQPGDRVRLTNDSLRGLEAIFQGDLGKQDRVSLLLELMDTYARIEVPSNQIEPLG